MKHRTCFFIVLFPILISIAGIAQQDWTLRLNRDGIKVYIKNSDSSSIKTVKAECELETSVSVLTAVLLNVNNSKEWIYATKRVALLQQLSPTDLIYYSEVALPWPISNRDFIVQLSVTQDSVTKKVKAVTTNKPDWLPRFKDIVRVEQAYSQWVITPVTNGKLHVEYELQVDPGGCIPVWLVNMFATTGPYYTFQKLREQVQKPEYRDTGSAFIKNQVLK